MSIHDDEDTRTYRVLVNHEEQYSLWLEYKDIPNGWRDAGMIGSRQACMAWVDEVWTDMRPLSLRKHMEETAEARKAQYEEAKAELEAIRAAIAREAAESSTAASPETAEASAG
ncbi:MAG: hypothetical protein EB084_14825 [Proteobacteria bacterium]|nr:hypothetical protein [Pseudomonadota bacterium]